MTASGPGGADVRRPGNML